MSEQNVEQACSHIRVSWVTRQDAAYATSGWWECSTCGADFVPLATAQERERVLVEALWPFIAWAQDVQGRDYPDGHDIRLILGRITYGDLRQVLVALRAVGALPKEE